MSFDYKNASKEELQAEYDRIAQEMGDDQFFTKKELNYLPEILQEKEEILSFSSGLMDGNTWLITLTNRRIIFLDKGMIYGLKQRSIPLNRVNAISGKTGIFLGEMVITDGAQEMKIENVWKKTVRTFTNKCEEAIQNFNKPNENSKSELKKAEINIVDEIRRLDELRKEGIISDEDFEKGKNKLLS